MNQPPANEAEARGNQKAAAEALDAVVGMGLAALPSLTRIVREDQEPAHRIHALHALRKMRAAAGDASQVVFAALDDRGLVKTGPVRLYAAFTLTAIDPATRQPFPC